MRFELSFLFLTFGQDFPLRDCRTCSEAQARNLAARSDICRIPDGIVLRPSMVVRSSTCVRLKPRTTCLGLLHRGCFEALALRGDEVRECDCQGFFTLTPVLSHQGRGNYHGSLAMTKGFEGDKVASGPSSFTVAN